MKRQDPDDKWFKMMSFCLWFMLACIILLFLNMLGVVGEDTIQTVRKIF